MMMTALPIAAPDAATVLEGMLLEGMRCIHCGRAWPRHPRPYMHTFTFASKSSLTCTTCTCENDHHEEPVWQAFEIVHPRGCVVLAGMVCPECVTAPGLDAVVVWAAEQAYRAD